MLLSLHGWFTEYDRPVPRVLVLDQPSQVIVMEHADLEDDVFSSAVREQWRHGDGALVPYEWTTG